MNGEPVGGESLNLVWLGFVSFTVSLAHSEGGPVGVGIFHLAS